MYSFSYLEPVCCSMSSFNCCFWPVSRFLKRQVRWSGIPISWGIFHSLLWSIFEISQYVTDLLHMYSVNVCGVNEQEQNKGASCSLFASIRTTLNRNDTGYNRGLVYGNTAASDRGPGFQDVAQESWLVEKSQKCKLGRNKFSLAYVKTWQISSGFVCSDWALV